MTEEKEEGDQSDLERKLRIYHPITDAGKDQLVNHLEAKARRIQMALDALQHGK